MSRGRPTEFKEDYIRQAYITCRDDGYTSAKLGKLFDVSRNTVGNWIRTIPEFQQAVRKGKDEYDCEKIEKALNKRAAGFRYTEITREPNADGVMTITKKVSKLVVPDTKACEIWLTNRNPDRWKKLKHIDVTSQGKPLIDIIGVQKLFAELEKRFGADWIDDLKESLSESGDNQTVK